MEDDVLKRARKVVFLCPMCEKNVVWARKVAILCPKLRHPSLRLSLMLCGEETIPPTLDSVGPSLCGQRGSTVSSSHTTLKRIASRKVLILLQEVSLAGKACVEWSGKEIATNAYFVLGIVAVKLLGSVPRWLYKSALR